MQEILNKGSVQNNESCSYDRTDLTLNVKFSLNWKNMPYDYAIAK